MVPKIMPKCTLSQEALLFLIYTGKHYTALLFVPQTSDRALYLLALAPFQYPIKDSKYKL